MGRPEVIEAGVARGEVKPIDGAGEKHDIVAMDDFIYGEPRARN